MEWKCHILVFCRVAGVIIYRPINFHDHILNGGRVIATYANLLPAAGGHLEFINCHILTCTRIGQIILYRSLNLHDNILKDNRVIATYAILTL